MPYDFQPFKKIKMQNTFMVENKLKYFVQKNLPN
jgi:hypothetical protein